MVTLTSPRGNGCIPFHVQPAPTLGVPVPDTGRIKFLTAKIAELEPEFSKEILEEEGNNYGIAEN